MEIPWESLDQDVLKNLLDEIVTRDGTDYGEVERTRRQKIDQLLTALNTGNAIIHWDVDSETASIIKK